MATKDNYFQARLIDRIDFTHDLCLMRFKPDGPFTFRPGQYATLALEDGEKLIQRAYSIVSAPFEPYLEFFMELVPHGDLTPRLWESKVNDQVLIRKKIVGAFTLDEKSGMKRHLMAATVTGTAPYISMVRAQKAELEKGKTDPQEFAIITGASRSWEMGVYHEELTQAARESWLHYTLAVSRPWEDTQWTGETGRVEDVLRKYADMLGMSYLNSVAYACGHPRMIDNVRGILARAGFQKERIRVEKFFTIADK